MSRPKKDKHNDVQTTTPVKEQRHRSNHHQEKGLYEWFIFAAAIVTGTACSVLSKVLYETRDSVHGHKFDKPIAQTLFMFMAMVLGIPLHWLIIYLQLPFPGYDRFVRREASSSGNHHHRGDPENSASSRREIPQDATPKVGSGKVVTTQPDEEMQRLLSPRHAQQQQDDDDLRVRIPLGTYFYLLIPAAFDCVATVLCATGLLFLDVSIYQLLRGSGIIFVAILRHYYLREHLYCFQWTGVAWNVVSVVLVGTAALLDSSSASSYDRTDLEGAMMGVMFMLAGSLVQSMMFVFEEKVMNLDEVRANWLVC